MPCERTSSEQQKSVSNLMCSSSKPNEFQFSFHAGGNTSSAFSSSQTMFKDFNTVYREIFVLKNFRGLGSTTKFSTCVKMAMYEYQLQWCVRRYHIYHIYKEEREAAIGEELKCEREKNNAKDPHAVAVVRENVIVGHLPRKTSRISALFLK